MNLKPVDDVFVLGKMLKTLQNEIKNGVWNEVLLNTWSSLNSLTDDSIDMSERLLDKNIINYFIECYELFLKNKTHSLSPMVGVFKNISNFSELRSRLMKPEFIRLVAPMISNENNLTSYLSCHLMANILSEGNDFWEQHLKLDQTLNRNSILAELKPIISEWKLDSFRLVEYLSFNTFKPFNRLLEFNDRIPQEVHYFAVRTLGYLAGKKILKYIVIY